MESEDQTYMANNDQKTMENNGPVANNETQWYQKFFVQDMCVQYPLPNTIPIIQYPKSDNKYPIPDNKYPIPETLLLPLGKIYQKPVKPPVDYEEK